MAKQRYIVPVFYIGLANFVVEVDEGEDPRNKAIEAFKNGAPEIPLGNEFEDIHRLGDPERITTE